MGLWTYYSPLLLGTLLAWLIAANSWSTVEIWPAWQRTLLLVLGCPLVGGLCQVGMLGAQGAFAQVLPVPPGRSIRGRAAVLTGAAILATLAAGAVAVFLAVQDVRAAAWTLAAIAALCLLLAASAYAWNIPAAVHDFGERRGG